MSENRKNQSEQPGSASGQEYQKPDATATDQSTRSSTKETVESESKSVEPVAKASSNTTTKETVESESKTVEPDAKAGSNGEGDE